LQTVILSHLVLLLLDFTDTIASPVLLAFIKNIVISYATKFQIVKQFQLNKEKFYYQLYFSREYFVLNPCVFPFENQQQNGLLKSMRAG